MKPLEVLSHAHHFMKAPWIERDNYLSDQWLPVLINMAYQCWLIYKLPVGTHITKVPGGWIFEAKFVKGAPSVRKSSKYFREAATKMLTELDLMDEDVEILKDPVV